MSVALAVLLSLVAFGCAPEDTAEGGCVDASDCPAGQWCDRAGQCLGAAGGGAGGGPPPERACESSNDCVDEAFPVVQDLYWDGDEQSMCVSRLTTCPQGGCVAENECRAPQGPLGGLSRCAQDTDCASGQCLFPTAEIGLCLRPCSTDSDCPLEKDAGGGPVGFACRPFELRGVLLRACMPVDETHPERTLCGVDHDCVPPGGDTSSELGCRFVGAPASPGQGGLSAVPVCDVRPPGARPTGGRCPPETAPGIGVATGCAGGACLEPCRVDAQEQFVAICEAPRRFCSEPCRRDDECPQRFTCTTGDDEERVGEWLDTNREQNLNFPGRNLRYCLLPLQGCLDERDCCPSRDAAGACEGGWSATTTRCGLDARLVAATPRLATICRTPDASLAPPGSCCVAHEACDSTLCVPVETGPCAGGSACSVPCAPDPDPDGVPGSGDEQDLCPELAATWPGLAGVTCRSFDYARSFEDARGEAQQLLAPLTVCR